MVPVESPAAPREPSSSERQPRPSMRILYRYVFREVLTPTLLAFAMCTFVLVMNQFFLLADYAYRFQVPLTELGTLFVLQLPHIIVLTLPMSLLFGFLVAAARMAADSELIALSASGISIAALLRPVLHMALGFAALTGWLLYDWMPRSNHLISQTVFEIFTENLLRSVQPGEFNSRLLPGFNLYVRSLERDDQGDLWEGVILEETTFRPKNQRREVFFAQQARPFIDEVAAVVRLRLIDVTVHSWPLDGGVELYEVRSMAEYIRHLPPPPLPNRGDRSESKSVRERTVPELFEYLSGSATQSERTVQLTKVEIHKRFAIPFACIVFAFLGLGLGASAKRHGRAFGFIASLPVILIYYQLFYAGERMAVNGDLPPWLSMWAGNILFGCLGLYLFYLRMSGGGIPVWSRLDLVGRLRFARAALIARRQAKAIAKSSASYADFDASLPAAVAVLGSGRARRRRLIPILDRYVLGLFARVLTMVILSALLLYVQVTLFQLLDDIFRYDIPFRMVAELYWAWTPEILTYVLPVSILISTVITFSLLTRTNEVTAMLIGGRSLYRLVVPVVALGALASLASVWIHQSWLPRSAERYDLLYERVQGMPERPKVTAARWIADLGGRHYYHFVAFDTDTGLFYQLSAFEMSERNFSPIRHAHGRRASWEGDQLVYEEGWTRKSAANGEWQRTTGARGSLDHFPTRRDDFVRQWRKPEYMTYGELRDLVQSRKDHGRDTRELEIELQTRRAYPMLPFVMLLLGLPFAFAVGRHGSLYGVGVSILLSVVYYSLVVFAIYLARLDILPPAIAAWSPNVVFGLLGLTGFLGLRT